VIQDVVRAWHQLVRGEVAGDRDAFLTQLLAEDVVFYSPVVFTPQKGRDITKLYLQAAAATFDAAPEGGAAPGGPGGFRYTKELVVGNQAALEFETRMGGKYVNGIDIIECNDAGRIIEFRVMIRPLQAVQAVHAAMGAMLEQLNSANAPGAKS
jgi:hypothetical protein